MSNTKTSQGRLSRLMPERLKRYMYEYLDTRVVFFIDLALSCLSSVLVLFLITLFANSKSAYQGHFVLWWLVGAAIASLAALLLFQNYKVVIRHSQLRDLVNIFWISILKVVLMFVVLAIVRKIVNPSTVLLGLLIDFLLTSFLLIALRLSMIQVRLIS